MLIEGIALNGLTMAGHAIFSHAIYDTYGLIKEANFHPHVVEVIGKLDLQADLEVVSALVKEVSERHPDELAKETSPLVIRLRQVDEMMKLIKSELETIQKETKEHAEKYFANWRTPDYEVSLKNLVAHKKTLDKRVDSLMELLKVF